MTKAQKSKRPVVAILVVVLIGLCVLAVVFVMQTGLLGQKMYPLKYEEEIAQYSEEYGLNPYYVAAVIYVESKFDSEAVSGPGATGLMQVMPDTGEWIAGKLGIEDFSEHDLLDPATNIRFGCWYLDFLNERFGGDKNLVAAAYNAGHGRVAEWLEDSGVSADGETLTDIPFAETEQYVERVNEAYEKYQKYYPDAFL